MMYLYLCVSRAEMEEIRQHGFRLSEDAFTRFAGSLHEAELSCQDEILIALRERIEEARTGGAG
ncbi:MAG TPA: hypothetical protein VF190_08385, partial [Rhodothermales bacterium]